MVVVFGLRRLQSGIGNSQRKCISHRPHRLPFHVIKCERVSLRIMPQTPAPELHKSFLIRQGLHADRYIDSLIRFLRELSSDISALPPVPVRDAYRAAVGMVRQVSEFIHLPVNTAILTEYAVPEAVHLPLCPAFRALVQRQMKPLRAPGLPDPDIILPLPFVLVILEPLCDCCLHFLCGGIFQLFHGKDLLDRGCKRHLPCPRFVPERIRQITAVGSHRDDRHFQMLSECSQIVREL